MMNNIVEESEVDETKVAIVVMLCVGTKHAHSVERIRSERLFHECVVSLDFSASLASGVSGELHLVRRVIQKTHTIAIQNHQTCVMKHDTTRTLKQTAAAMSTQIKNNKIVIQVSYPQSMNIGFPLLARCSKKHTVRYTKEEALIDLIETSAHKQPQRAAATADF